MMYLFPDAALRLYTDHAALFILGTASGALILCSLARLRWFSLIDWKQIPRKEYQYRITAIVSILLTALGMAFLFIPGSAKYSALAASVIQMLGFLGFELSLSLLLLLRCFPHWGTKQLLPLPLMALITVLLPLTGPGAPMLLSVFSFALCGLFMLLFYLQYRQKKRCTYFLWGMVFFLVIGLSFILPLGRGAFFWPAAFLAYLFLEHKLFPVPQNVSLEEVSIEAEAPVELSGPELPKQTALGGEAEELMELDEEGETLPVVAVNESSDGTTHEVASFIPREFLSILNKKGYSELKLGDHIEQEMTIFFSDIRQYTDLSEDLSTEESFAFINSYLSRIVPEITKYGGFVDKYIGDAILALFPNANGADMAVRSAVAIQEKVLEYNGHRAKCNYRPLSIGIGIHTGTLMVGVVGTAERMQSTVISDAVNLASRVESLTKAFRVSMAISEETFKKLEDPGSYQYRFVGKVRVKGKSEPVSIFEIFDGVDEKLQRKKLQANRFFEQGMFLYYQKKYSDALQNFRHVMEFLPEDGAAAFYIDNCMAKLRQQK